MKLYQCKVRLDGNIQNEIQKINVTAAEIMMLRLVHGGDDAVVDIKEIGEDKQRSNEVERGHLQTFYRDFIGKTPAGEIDPMMKLFGPEHMPLPGEIKVSTFETEDPEQVAGMLA